MNDQSSTNIHDLVSAPLGHATRQSSVSSSRLGTDGGTGLSLWDSDVNFAYTPGTSPPSSYIKNPYNENTTVLNFDPPITFSFTKGTRLFKLRYAQVDVCKNAVGSLRCLELTDPLKQESTSIHTFPNTQLPVPHLEQPYAAGQAGPFRVSFLDEQTMQTAQTLFQAKPNYVFERWEDCRRFQEAILGQTILFVAGIAEIKSKGRGEECISQNLRVLQAPSGRKMILFFSNSQKREKKRYTSITLDNIESVDPGKKASKPVTIKLQPINELTSQLKGLQIQFLEEEDRNKFLKIL